MVPEHGFSLIAFISLMMNGARRAGAMKFGGRGVERIAVQSAIRYHRQFMRTGIETDIHVLYLAIPKGE
jgi:hypothetical protein